MNNFQLSALPLNVRRAIYGVFMVLAVAAGATDTAYGHNDPHWLTVAQNVIEYLGGAVGLTALTHTVKAPATVSTDPTEDDSDATRGTVVADPISNDDSVVDQQGVIPKRAQNPAVSEATKLPATAPADPATGIAAPVEGAVALTEVPDFEGSPDTVAPTDVVGA